MPTIRLETRIHAPVERCFDLARDVGAHVGSTSRTRERAVSGVTTGLLGLGDVVTWEATHLGVRQRLTVRITRFEPPHRFIDEMVSGAFHGFTHEHTFETISDGTLMVDVFAYTSPLGPLGRIADRLFLCRYMRTFLAERNRYLKQMAERTIVDIGSL